MKIPMNKILIIQTRASLSYLFVRRKNVVIKSILSDE